MSKYGILLLVPLLVFSFVLCGQCLARDTEDESQEEESLTDEEVTPAVEIAPEEAVPAGEETEEGEAEAEEVEVEAQVDAGEEPPPEASVDAEAEPGPESAVDAEEEPPSEEEVVPAKEVTREELLESLGEVHGKRERRRFKAAYWAAGLEGDKKEIFDTYGYPSTRYREDKLGELAETWTYIEEGKQFVFRDNKLIRTNKFRPGTTPR